MGFLGVSGTSGDVPAVESVTIRIPQFVEYVNGFSTVCVMVKRSYPETPSFRVTGEKNRP
jgi:hypothetical protein